MAHFTENGEYCAQLCDEHFRPSGNLLKWENITLLIQTRTESGTVLYELDDTVEELYGIVL